MLRSRRRPPRDHRRSHGVDRGFTLVEILVAIVLVGILSAVVVVGVGKLVDQGNGAACTQSMDSARTASTAYFATNLSYPTTFDQLTSTSLLQLPAGATVDSSGTLVHGSGWTLRLAAPATATSPPSFACGTATSSYLTAVVADAPSAYWRFDRTGNPLPLVTGSGASIAPIWSNASTSPFPEAAMAMNAAVVPFTAPSTAASGTATIELWVHPTSTTVVPISFGNGGSGTPSLWLRPEGFGFNTGSGDIWGTDALALNTWSHVVAVFPNGSRASARLFVDGTEKTLTQRVGSTPTIMPNLGTNGYLGAFGPWSYTFTGALAELAIYPSTTDPTSVAAHAGIRSAAAYRAAVVSGSPSAYWRLGLQPEAVVTSGGASLFFAAPGAPSPFGGVNAGLGTGTYPFTAPAYVTSGAFTVEFWMRPTATNTIPISFGAGNVGTTSLWLRTEGFGFNTGNGDIWGAAPPPLNAWTHVVAKFPTLGSSSGARLFLNGVEQTLTQRYGPGPNPGAYASRTAYLGSFGAGAFQFPGALAELAFYPSTTDPAVIARHAAIANP